MKNSIIVVFMLVFALVLFSCDSLFKDDNNNITADNETSNNDTYVNNVASLTEPELDIQGTWIMDRDILHPDEIDFFRNDSRRIVLRYTWGGIDHKYFHPEYIFSGFTYDGENITFLTQGSNPREIMVTGILSEDRLTISGFTIFQHSSAQIVPGVYTSRLDARHWNGTYVRKEQSEE
jgi:hypothetical protein